MNTVINPEQQMLAEIEQLKTQFTQTQDLYREVCVLMFFRYGIAPTANKLYQYVRKGSMSAPAEALNTFWTDLRAKSRVRIERPDLPDHIKEAAGNFAATLWSQAQESAQLEFSAQMAEANEKVMSVQQENKLAQDKTAETETVLNTVQLQLEDANQRIAEAEKNHAVDISTLATLEKSLNTLQIERDNFEQALVTARTGFSNDIEKINVALHKAEERYRALEARSLVETDRERQRSSRLEKELLKVRETAREDILQQQRELTSLQNIIHGLKEKIGTLSGQLNAMTSQQKETARRLKLAEKKLVAQAQK